MHQPPPMPDRWAPIIEQVGTFLRAMDTEMDAWKAHAPVDYGMFEETVAEHMQAIECAAHGIALRRLDVDAPYLQIWGDAYRRVGRTTGHYHCMAGDISLDRTLYRKMGERSGKTIDAVSLRAGVVADGWTPRAARAIGHLMAQGTSREARATSTEVMRLPYSRSRFERVGHEVGRQYRRAASRIEDALICEYELPATATSISVSIDRTTVPMEEPIVEQAKGDWLIAQHAEEMKTIGQRFDVSAQTEAVLEETRDAIKTKRRKIERNWRMAYVATVRIHDAESKALHTIRYGRMPAGNVDTLCKRLLADVVALRQKRDDLAVSLLADGAPEMWTLLDGYFTQRTLGIEPTRLIDFWHLAEYLGSAAQALQSHVQVRPGQLRR